jgi:hypothetical protein
MWGIYRGLLQPSYGEMLLQSNHYLTRACSGWPQYSGNDSKILATADAQAVMRLEILKEEDVLRFLIKQGI